MRFSAIGTFTFFLFFSANTAYGRDLPLDRIKLPPGFTISLYADNVPGARSMALSPDGTLFVGTRGSRIYALPNRKHGKRADEVIVLADDLDTPNGVAFRDGALYVAEINRILRFDGIELRLRNLPKPVVVSDRFPNDAYHGWKFIRFGPDGLLYVPVGAPCNICEPDPARYAAIFRMKPDGTALEQYVRGVRNTVGFDWGPDTGELWFTDNGRDWLGNNVPPDELNHVPRPGMHFGYPYCHGKAIADDELGGKHACGEFTPAAMELGPHVASLGMRFYTGKMFPESYRKQVFIAEHGSWNRIPSVGYRITLVRLKNGQAASYESFAEGWLQGLAAWGRPVDVQVMLRRFCCWRRDRRTPRGRAGDAGRRAAGVGRQGGRNLSHRLRRIGSYSAITCMPIPSAFHCFTSSCNAASVRGFCASQPVPIERWNLVPLKRPCSSGRPPSLRLR